MSRRIRRIIAAACAGALVAVAGIVLAVSQQDGADAADASNFQAGYLISDEKFYDADSMTVSEIQNFLNQQGDDCAGNCLKTKRVSTSSKAANSYCGAYQGASNESAAQIIAKVGQACGISPKVLLVMLEKETSLVTMDNPGEWRYERAMGYYCPDDPSRPGWCNPEYAGLFNQLYRAAWQLNQYAANPYDYAYVAGRNNSILYNPDRSCGSSTVYIKNQATASLYIYTPYQPNQAALNNLYGTGNSCSTYGNRNFWRLYTDWFGSTTGVDGKSPIGHYDSLSAVEGGFRMRGWAYDPDAEATSLYIWVSIDGKGQHILANKSRTDVARVVSGASKNQGFDQTFQVAPGEHTVCATAHNLGGGQHKSLGCKTVETGSSPVGRFDSIAAQSGAIRITGWAVDPDAATTPLYMWVSIDGQGQHIRANKARPDVSRVFPNYGSSQGFDSVLAVSAGAHKVCVTAHNIYGGSHTGFGCKTVTVTASSTSTSSTARTATADSAKSAQQRKLSVVPEVTEETTPATDESQESQSSQALTVIPAEPAETEPAGESVTGKSAAPANEDASLVAAADVDAVEPSAEESEPAATTEPSAAAAQEATEPASTEPASTEPASTEPASTAAEPTETVSAEPAVTESAAAEPETAEPETQAPQEPLSVIPADAAENAEATSVTELAATGAQPMTTPVLIALAALLISAAALLGVQRLRRED